MEKENTVDISPPITKDVFVQTEIFKDLNNQMAMRYGFQGEAFEKDQQIAKLKTALHEQGAEISDLSRQVALLGEIIAHVKTVCADNTSLMTFIEAKLQNERKG